MNSSTVKRNANGNIVWTNDSKQEQSPRRPLTGLQEACSREYINPVARALHDNETWTIGDDGEFCPTIPFCKNQ